MKITTLLLILSITQVSANVFAQEVSLIQKDITLKKIFREIRKQTGYNVFYSDRKVNDSRKLNVNFKNTPLQQVLNESFKGMGLTFSIQDKAIFIEKEEPVVSKTIAAANINVHGRIVDIDGGPLPGASVTIKGTNGNAISTNKNGEFYLQNIDEQAILIISFIGYTSKELKAAKELGDIVLEASDAKLDEVVVVAYGRQRKATLTGAISTISTKEIKQSPAANLAVTLTGRLPGLFAQQKSGEPGRDATLLFMRGRGTLNGSSPLILVDGVERDLTAIDPNEVESVSILKDASSTALFGVRGANGVILVTTKRGTETIPAIGLTIESGMQAFTRQPTSVESYDWAKLKNEAWRNDFPNPAANNFPPYSDYALERYKLQDQPEAYPNNNWMDILMKKWVPQTRYNATMNGRGANIGYFVNVGYLDQSGQWKIDPEVTGYDPSQYLKRYNFRSNIDATLNKSKTLTMFLNASGSLEKVNGPFVEARFDNSTATGEIVNRILNYFPSIQPGPLTPGGEVLVGGGNYGESPWAQINRTGYRRESRSGITASWGLNQKMDFLTKGLSARVMLSFDTRSLHYLNASKSYQYWVQVIDPNSKTPDGKDVVTYQRTRTDFGNTPLNTSISAQFQSFYDTQVQLNYDRTFGGKHTFTGLLLASQQALIKPSDALPFNVRGLATRLTYAYDSRYVAEFNAGYNGSEQFAKGKRYGFFPSGSVGWNIQNEQFFESYRNAVNLFKIRASYGAVGGDQLGSRRFLYLDDIKRGTGSYSATLGRGANIMESFFGNPNVQWEVAKKRNLGIELGLFNQLTLTADFFKERRDNVLIYRGSIPLIIGVPASSLAPSNIGIIENKGYEFELNYQKAINQDLSILSKLNFNYAANKILFNDEVILDEDYAYRYRTTGYQIGQQWGYKSLGFFNSQEEINAYGVTYQGRAPRPGDLKFQDLNGDKIINDKDMMPIGESSVPKYSWGAAVNVTYKNFDISVLFQGAFKVTGQVSSYELNDFRERHLHAWTAERAASGYDIQYPALSLSTSSSQNSNTYFNQNKSFIRLKNLELGYTLRNTLVSKLGVKSFRVYLNGLNLITWDKMAQKDWDPELENISTFPVYKVFNAGINVNF